MVKHSKKVVPAITGFAHPLVLPVPEQRPFFVMNDELLPLVALGRHMAERGFRPHVTTAGVWLVTGKVDQAKGLFGLLWGLNALRCFMQMRVGQGDACAAFTLGYLIESVGLPDGTPPPFASLVDALDQLVAQEHLVTGAEL